MYKAIFLDRDGVINKNPKIHEYITSWNEFEFLPGVLSALAKIAKTKYKIIIITNQRGISKGEMAERDLSEIHSKMIKKINDSGGRIDDVYFCPHGKNQCNCRKPLPGMLNKAVIRNDISLKDSWFIGDSLSDITLGNSKGCKTIYIGKIEKIRDLSNFSVNSLGDAVDLILSRF